MMNDPISSALSKIHNAEKANKTTVEIYPTSKLLKQTLEILQSKGYIGAFKETKTQKGTIIEINLMGRINKCNAIKPRYSVKADEIEKFEKRYLPAKGFGILIISTPQGLMTNEDTADKQIGGRLLAFCYQDY